MPWKKTVLVLIGLLGLISLDSGTRFASAARRIPYGGTLRLPLLETVQRLDPVRISTWSEWLLARQVYDTLYRLNANGEVIPALAYAIPEQGGREREWLIHLKPGLQFHDGSSITASEVVGSWQRLLDKNTGSPYWWLLSMIEGAMDFRQGRSTGLGGVQRVNKSTIRVRITSDVAEFIEALAAVPTAPLPQRYLTGKQHKDEDPPGCGPFVPGQTGAGADRILTPFAGHWQGRPFVDRLVFKQYENQRSAGLAFELGETQVNDAPGGARQGKNQAIQSPMSRLVMLMWSPERAADYPEGFRQAIERAIDRKALVEYIVGERGCPVDELLDVNSEQGDPFTARTDAAVSRSYFQRLTMRRMGIPLMLEFLVRAEHPMESAVAERIQVGLKDVGVSVFTIPLRREDYESRVREGRYDLILSEPLPLVHSPVLQLLSVACQLADEDGLGSLVAWLAGIQTGENRIGMVRERARSLLMRSSVLPLFRYRWGRWLHESVHGYRFDSRGMVDLADVWLARSPDSG